MDGTALGILRCLSSFQQITCAVPSAKRTAVEHYIMRTPNKRLFVESIFVSSKTKVKCDEFTVRRKKLAGTESNLLNKYLSLKWVGIASNIQWHNS